MVHKNTETFLRRSWAEVDLSVLKKNYEIYRASLPEDAEIMAVVKANAYGHGSRPVAAVLQEAGVSRFAVASLAEAVKLRKDGVQGEILILGYTPVEGCRMLSEYHITQTLVSEHLRLRCSATLPSTRE